MLPKLTFVSVAWFICLCIAGCVTAIDPSLPHADLPSLTLATDVPLVASPAHPNANLTASPVAAGSQVTLLGATKDMSWLLVLHERVIGWMPTFFSRDNISTLTPAITFTQPVDQCTTYLDATFAPDEPWSSTVDGTVRLVGAIYRPATQSQFTDSTLNIAIDGAGEAIDGDYVHAALTPSISLVLFTYNLRSLQKGSQVSFTLDNTANEAVVFEAAYFADSCAETERFTGQLSVGVPKGVSGQITTPPLMEPTATPSPASIEIVHRSDARTPTLTPTLTPFPTLDIATYGAPIPILEVTASSSYVMSNRDAPSAVDNNIVTYWSSNFDDDIGAWLQLQLPTTTTVAGIHIYTSGPRGGLGQPHELTLIFSDDSSQQITLENEEAWQYRALVPISTANVRIVVDSVYELGAFRITKFNEIQILSAPPTPEVIKTDNGILFMQLHSESAADETTTIGNLVLNLLRQDKTLIRSVVNVYTMEQDVAGEWLRLDLFMPNMLVDDSSTFRAELPSGYYLLTNSNAVTETEPIVPGWYSDEGYNESDKAQYRGIIFPVEAGKTTEIEVQFSRLAVGVLDEAGKAVRSNAHPGWTVAVCADALDDVADEMLRCAGQAIDRRGAAAFQLAPGDYHIRVTTDAACYWEFPVTVDLHEAKEELVTIDRSQPDGCGDAAN